jgi:hypothetical protein
MTHEAAYNEVTAFIEKAIQINLQMGEPELAYQKHLLLSFANSLKQKHTDYKKNLEVLITMCLRAIEVNTDYKEYTQADQIRLIYELAMGLQDRCQDDKTNGQLIELLN